METQDLTDIYLSLIQEVVAKLLGITWCGDTLYQMQLLGVQHDGQKLVKYISNLLKSLLFFFFLKKKSLLFILLMVFGFVLSLLGLLGWETCSKSLPGKLKTIHIFSWILKVSSKNQKIMMGTFYILNSLLIEKL